MAHRRYYAFRLFSFDTMALSEFVSDTPTEALRTVVLTWSRYGADKLEKPLAALPADAQREVRALLRAAAVP